MVVRRSTPSAAKSSLRCSANSPAFLEQGGGTVNRQAFITEASGAGPGGLGFFPEWAELSDTIWTPGQNSIWAGEATAAEALPTIADQINQFLADNGYPK